MAELRLPFNSVKYSFHQYSPFKHDDANFPITSYKTIKLSNLSVIIKRCPIIMTQKPNFSKSQILRDCGYFVCLIAFLFILAKRLTFLKTFVILVNMNHFITDPSSNINISFTQISYFWGKFKSQNCYPWNVLDFFYVFNLMVITQSSSSRPYCFLGTTFVEYWCCTMMMQLSSLFSILFYTTVILSISLESENYV